MFVCIYIYNTHVDVYILTYVHGIHILYVEIDRRTFTQDKSKKQMHGIKSRNKCMS